jgi:hypothetical protein
MSLNRNEQMVFDYLQTHPEERQHWVAKVRAAAFSAVSDHAAATRLESELWHYYEERSAVAAPFRDVAQREGLRRISMKNLAEYLLRLWTEPRPKKKRTTEAPREE